MSALVSDAERVAGLVARGALFALSDSGGKDSQAMRIRVLRLVPPAQAVVVHASLGDVEWPGALEHARDGATRAGVEFIVARSPKTFFELVEHRASLGVVAWPTAANRQCTSDLKRDPIMREVRRAARARGTSLIVTCMGLRAEESARRSRANPWATSKRGSVAGREWLEWLPIHHLTKAEVFDTIAEAGEKPHPAYALGNDRLSCVFCILASRGDLQRGARAHPELLARYVALEERTGYRMHASRLPLAQLVAGASS